MCRMMRIWISTRRYCYLWATIIIFFLAFDIAESSSSSLGLNYGHYHSSSMSSSRHSNIKKKRIPTTTTSITKIKEGCVICLSMIKNGVDMVIEETAKCISKPPPVFILQSIYWLTAADAAQCVLMNDYSSYIKFLSAHHTTKKHGVQIISLFARVRPRLLFSVGSLLRALQVVTPLQRIFDPSIGVGAGINICAMIAGSRWVKPLILGWTITKWAWLWLGARPPDHVHVPIVLSIRELERHKKQDQT